MEKKKSLTIGIIGFVIFLVIVIVAAIGGVLIYQFNHPDIEINVSNEKKMDANFQPVDDYSFGQVVFTTNGKLKLIPGMPESFRKKWTEMESTLAEFENGIKRDYDSPLDITCDVEIIDGRTYVTYSGTATRRGNGVTEDIDRQFVFEFVLTDKIKYNK